MSTKALFRRNFTRRARFEHLESRYYLSATRATQAVNDFGVDLYAQLQQEQGNLFFSPLSVATALAMTYAGAAGETAAEMEQVLHLGTEPGIHESFAALLSSLTDSTAADDGFQLEIANAIWPQMGFPIHDEFIHTIETDYQGATQSLDLLFQSGSGNGSHQLVGRRKDARQGAGYPEVSQSVHGDGVDEQHLFQGGLDDCLRSSLD
jgi:hypothetical protein